MGDQSIPDPPTPLLPKTTLFILLQWPEKTLGITVALWRTLSVRWKVTPLCPPYIVSFLKIMSFLLGSSHKGGHWHYHRQMPLGFYYCTVVVIILPSTVLSWNTFACITLFLEDQAEILARGLSGYILWLSPLCDLISTRKKRTSISRMQKYTEGTNLFIPKEEKLVILN